MVEVTNMDVTKDGGSTSEKTGRRKNGLAD